MLIAMILLGLLASSGQAVVAEPAFERVEELIRVERWSKAKRALHEHLETVLEKGGEMDGADLLRAVRLRSLIEAGKGDSEAAVWWWHAGLNLQSDGAEAELALVSDEVAAVLRPVRVRPRQPPETLKLPKLKGKPTTVHSPLRDLATRRLRGTVTYEIQLGEAGQFQKPLLVEASVPAAGIYAFLDAHSGFRFPTSWMRYLGETIELRFVFRNPERR